MKAIVRLVLAIALLQLDGCEYITREATAPSETSATPDSNASESTRNPSLASIEGNADGYMGDDDPDVYCEHPAGHLINIGRFPSPTQDADKLRARIRFQRENSPRVVSPFVIDQANLANPRHYRAPAFELSVNGAAGTASTWFDATFRATIDTESIVLILKCRIIR